MGDNENQLFAEWCKQTYASVTHSAEIVEEMRKECRECRAEMNGRISKVETRLAVISAIALLIVAGLELAAKFIK